MSPPCSLSKDPFYQLDSYNDQAFLWAKEQVEKIDINKLKEKEQLIISICFAYIFGVFIHVTMDNLLIDFKDFLRKNTKKSTPATWHRIQNCIHEIYGALILFYKDPMKLYLTLYDSILIEVEDDGYSYGADKPHYIKVEPQGYDEDKGFGYVAGGFGF